MMESFPRIAAYFEPSELRSPWPDLVPFIERIHALTGLPVEGPLYSNDSLARDVAPERPSARRTAGSPPAALSERRRRSMAFPSI